MRCWRAACPCWIPIAPLGCPYWALTVPCEHTPLPSPGRAALLMDGPGLPDQGQRRMGAIVWRGWSARSRPSHHTRARSIPRISDAGLLIEVKDQHYGKIIQPGPIAWLEGCPPVAGENTRTSVDAEARECYWRSVESNDEAALRRATVLSPWLEGITILDMTNVIAGPTIAGTLARFGARVIRLIRSRRPMIPGIPLFSGFMVRWARKAFLWM